MQSVARTEGLGDLPGRTGSVTRRAQGAAAGTGRGLARGSWPAAMSALGGPSSEAPKRIRRTEGARAEAAESTGASAATGDVATNARSGGGVPDGCLAEDMSIAPGPTRGELGVSACGGRLAEDINIAPGPAPLVSLGSEHVVSRGVLSGKRPQEAIRRTSPRGAAHASTREGDDDEGSRGRHEPLACRTGPWVLDASAAGVGIEEPHGACAKHTAGTFPWVDRNDGKGEA